MIGMCRWVFPGSPGLVGSYAFLWPPTQWILLQHCCQCMCSSRTLAVSWLRTRSDNRAESVGSKHMFVSNSWNAIGYWVLSLSHVSFSLFSFGILITWFLKTALLSPLKVHRWVNHLHSQSRLASIKHNQTCMVHGCNRFETLQGTNISDQWKK